MSTKRQRSGRWHYVIKRSILPKPVYLSFDTEREGDEYVKRVEALLDRGVVPDNLIPAATHRAPVLRECVRGYLAKQHVSPSDKTNLQLAVASLPAGLELKDISFTWATAWITEMKRGEPVKHTDRAAEAASDQYQRYRANLSPSTIKHRVGALARCFDWIAAHGDLNVNPLRLLPKTYATYTREDAKAAIANGGVAKKSEERDRRMSAVEELAIRQILAGAKPEGRERAFELNHGKELELLFDLALETAMRLREMFTIGLDQLDLPARTIFLDKTKNGDKRQVPLTTTALARIKNFHPKGQLLFPWWDGNAKADSLARTTSLLSRQFGRIFDAAGCGDLRFHDLRHEATSRFFERSNLGALEIAKITGHRSPRSLMRYANLRASTLADRLW